MPRVSLYEDRERLVMSIEADQKKQFFDRAIREGKRMTEIMGDFVRAYLENRIYSLEPDIAKDLERVAKATGRSATEVLADEVRGLARRTLK